MNEYMTTFRFYHVTNGTDVECDPGVPYLLFINVYILHRHSDDTIHLKHAF